MKPFPEVLIELKASKSVPGEVGIFAVRPIKKGEVILRTDDDPVTEDERISMEEFKTLSADMQERIKNFCVEEDDGYYVGAGMNFNELPSSWYINHSCEPNLGFNKDADYVAMRDIEKGEELSYDYGFVEGGKYMLNCLCGTPSCRKIIRGNDHLDPEFRKKYGEYLHPDFR